jgi:ornithine cyclodeaminase/alanine dehydrogenase-like protein (mu-crystallin family)
MDPLYINKEKVASLLPMRECIPLMEEMFRRLANGECLQPLRTLMWLPDKSGLLGMMPGYARGPGVMGLKVITIFPGNGESGYPSHQGVVILFGARHGEPLMIFDAAEITAIRTAAASAVATRLLSRKNSELLAIIGLGEQAERHVEAIGIVRKIKRINLWGRNEDKAAELAGNLARKYGVPVHVSLNAREAVRGADIICTVTSSREPVILGDWISKGAHINAVGSSTPGARELDTSAVLRSKLFTDRYESLFNEAGDFLIPKKEGVVSESDVKGELGEVLIGTKTGREDKADITLFKSLGIAAEDLFSAWHIYQKLTSYAF